MENLFVLPADHEFSRYVLLNEVVSLMAGCSRQGAHRIYKRMQSQHPEFEDLPRLKVVDGPGGQGYVCSADNLIEMVPHMMNKKLQRFCDKHLGSLVRYIRGDTLSVDEVAAVARTIEENKQGKRGTLYVATSPLWNFVKVGMTSGTYEKLWSRYLTIGGGRSRQRTSGATKQSFCVVYSTAT